MGKKKVKYPCPPDKNPKYWNEDIGYYDSTEEAWDDWFKMPREERARIVKESGMNPEIYL